MADGPNASRGGGGGRHLDAAGSREVVFCHMCSHEWYQDEAGLTCPRCEGDITEIVSLMSYAEWDIQALKMLIPV